MTAVEEAQRLLASGQSTRAIACLDRAAARGDALSWFELGILYLAGKQVARDLSRARDCFKHAGELGNRAGKNIHIQLTALGVGGELNWAEALGGLRALATTDELAAVQVGLLDEMDLASDGAPSGEIARQQLSSNPHVWSFDGFFSPAEAAYLIDRAKAFLQPSLVVDPATGALAPNPVRTSHGMSFPWVSEDLVIQALTLRIALASNTSPAVGEPLQVLRSSRDNNTGRISMPSIRPTISGS